MVTAVARDTRCAGTGGGGARARVPQKFGELGVDAGAVRHPAGGREPGGCVGGLGTRQRRPPNPGPILLLPGNHTV